MARKKPLLIKAKEGLYQTAWTIRAGIPSKPDDYISVGRHEIGDGQTADSVFATAWKEATELAEAPCNADLEIVVCATGY